MEIVLATDGFAGFGGSETYVLTVADQLRRLGHGVTIHAVRRGAISSFAAQRGLDVSFDEDELPDHCDAILVQDAAMAYALADRWPSTPQVFRACSDVYDFQLPPHLPGIVGVVVVLSDRMGRQIAALTGRHELVRLRQPVDTDRFRPRSEIGRMPRRAVVLSNYLSGGRSRLLAEAWSSADLEVTTVGGPAASSATPEASIAEADIVVGKARAIVEAMACGRAAYVLDVAGGDGWVTPETYPAMEADNFAGQATDWSFSRERLVADLREYRQEMGLANRDLVLAHHTARDHVQDLVEVFRRLGPQAERVAAPLQELARLARHQWSTELDAITFRRELEQERGRVRALEARVAELQASADQRLVALDEYARGLEADGADLRRQLSTRRVRAGLAIGRLADAMRPRRPSR